MDYNIQDILSQLNESQRKAVEYLDGPQLVIAGAGSGKTRVLTYKIAYLIARGLQPWSILALTFTNKAAKEMKERIATIVGDQAALRLNMGTFHSVFARILRAEAEHIGYSSQFTIYDEADSRSLLKNIAKELKLDDKLYKPATVHKHISLAKNKLVAPEAYAADNYIAERDDRAQIPQTAEIYRIYQQRLLQANAMDFDDLLVLTFRLLSENEAVRRKYAERFAYVLVDEYQDTNYAQQRILTLLTRENQRICVVGDDYQSIYAFRGANIDNILDFQHQYPNALLFKLERNYRSTQTIVEAANSIMQKNRRQIPKQVYSENEEGDKISVIETYSDKEEAIVVCNTIKRYVNRENSQYSDFAILYRANALCRSFEEELRKQNIPYTIFGGQSFYQRKEIKDVMAYFRLVANPNDEEAFRRVVNYPARGIGNTTIQKLASAAVEYGVSFWSLLENPTLYKLDVNKGTLTKLDRFKQLIDSFVAEVNVTDAYTLGEDILKNSGIMADLAADVTVEGETRRENIDAFISSIHDFVEAQREEGRENDIYLSNYLQEVSLLTDLESDEDGDTQNRVSLMTVHAAKGLEFNTVFIVGVEDSIFPSQMSMDSPRGLEEERRLMYVAMTRAEKHCYITHVKSRFRYGRAEFMNPSMFLREISSKYVSMQNQSMGESSRGSRWGESSRGSRWCGDNYESNTPYRGAHGWDSDTPHYGRGMQNNRPVADRLVADPKPKITRGNRSEEAVDQFSDKFKQLLAASGGNFKRVSEAMTNGGRQMPSASSSGSSLSSAGMSTSSSSQSSASAGSLHTGNVIEHLRFGIGRVLNVEGSGENTKATVEFENVGTKQLLLKFAKFRILE